MRVEHKRKQHALVRPLIGVAMLAVAAAASGQQPQAQQELRVAAASGAAQQPAQPIWNGVRIIHVKSDRVPEFEGLIKELGPAVAKQGGGFNVWQVALGDQNTFHIVSQMPSFASAAEREANPPMEKDQWANWLKRIQATIDSQVVSVAQVHPDLSIIPQEQAGAPTADLLILVSQTLLPGKREQYVGWLKNELVPALRKSGVTGMVSNEMAFGSEDREWVFAVPIAKWSELDKPMPLFTSMGQQAGEQLLNRGDSMVERSETIVLRTRADLSVAVPAGQQSGQQR